MYTVEQTHWWFCAKRNIALSLLEQNMPVVDTPLQLLDIGCGCGQMIQSLKKWGCVVGIDFSDLALDYCRHSFSGELIQWDLNKPLDLGKRFHGIVALDVLEHIRNEEVAIKTLADALKPGGVAVVTVPANPWMWSMNDESCMHMRRYTKQSFEKLLDISGLCVEYLSYYNFWLFSAIAAFRLLEKCLPIRSAGAEPLLENKIPPAAVNRMCYNIFNAEKGFICRGRHFPWGVSLIAVLKKEAEHAI